MSAKYDLYLTEHRENVINAYIWLCDYLPEVIYNWQYTSMLMYKHDQSKNEKDEYEAYDAYFYGGNRSYEVVTKYHRAWLKHIHRNPHHWQHWVLINDDPDEGEVVLAMPNHYIIEMICDWWSFSWAKNEPEEIFDWWDKHSEYIKLEEDTRKTVIDILERIKEKLHDPALDDSLYHHGIKGQKKGVRNGPPYPLNRSKSSLKNAAGQPIISVEHIELVEKPNSITQAVRKNGGIDRNYYGSDGKQTKQISNHDHNQPQNHPYGENGEHAHDYIYDENGNLCDRPARELTTEERKENGDIL